MTKSLSDASEANMTRSNDIIGYDDILAQMKDAARVIDQACPHTLFTIGGSCDADIPAVAYLNKKYAGNLTVLWFDAHGDLNTPRESASKLFYGMPLRALLGDGDDEIAKLIHRLTPPQIILLGARDMDKSEEKYIAENNITLFSVEEMERGPSAVFGAIEAAGNDNLYLHIDLDVLNPSEFPHTPVPSDGGLSARAFLSILHSLKEMYRVVGMGVFEYKPANTKLDLLSSVIDMGLCPIN
jgi:arginase